MSPLLFFFHQVNEACMYKARHFFRSKSCAILTVFVTQSVICVMFLIILLLLHYVLLLTRVLDIRQPTPCYAVYLYRAVIIAHAYIHAYYVPIYHSTY
ncbi:hypothetical protein GGI43DRAFT_326011 [Trichoderma evansii]